MVAKVFEYEIAPGTVGAGTVVRLSQASIKINAVDTGEVQRELREERIRHHELVVREWFLAWAVKLNGPEPEFQHAGFAGLHIALSYFEQHAVYHDGDNRRGKAPFTSGVLLVFPELKALSTKHRNTVLDTLWDARNGLFHESAVRAGLLLGSRLSAPLVPLVPKGHRQVTHVLLDRDAFVERIVDHQERFLDQLRDPADPHKRHAAFKKGWTLIDNRARGTLRKSGRQGGQAG